jgi:hypothetical protein
MDHCSADHSWLLRVELCWSGVQAGGLRARVKAPVADQDLRGMIKSAS